MERRGQGGQSAVEVVALVPLLALLLALGVGLATVAAGWLSAAGAARVGARAAELGEPVGPSVREALPRPAAATARVVERARWVEVRLPAPDLGPLGRVPLPPARSRRTP